MGRRGAGVRRWTLANGWTAAHEAVRLGLSSTGVSEPRSTPHTHETNSCGEREREPSKFSVTQSKK